MPLFGAAFAAQNKGTTVLSNLDLYHQCYFLQKIEEFKDFSRPLCNFPALFKPILFSRTFQESPLNSSTSEACANPDL